MSECLFACFWLLRVDGMEMWVLLLGRGEEVQRRLNGLVLVIIKSRGDVIHGILLAERVINGGAVGNVVLVLVVGGGAVADKAFFDTVSRRI